MRVAFLVLSIFVAIWFVFINVVKGIRGQAIPGGNAIIMSLAITAIITYLMGIW